MAVEAYLGDMMPFAGDFTVEGYGPCDNTLISINQNQALYTILGTRYGGDGRTTFALPDLRGRNPIRYGAGPGLAQYMPGQMGGLEQTVLSQSNLPAHTHYGTLTIAKNDGNATEPEPDKGLIASGYDMFFNPSAFEEAKLTQIQGIIANKSNLPERPSSVNVRNPYLAVGWQICVLGAYPRRA
ncbi:phage tail protein [Pseudoalteromonas viridis]|uniref:Tail fiber protein n=1 Tax=Pseudoalteromonas viridis TaxID=339617 RepID=A0ABX7V573_9GAMM|nr:tail fiber protein [Pseudoalteromonas viridis]QTL33858.1 tail fiber protein [Pseudoalteromonas viridis]